MAILLTLAVLCSNGLHMSRASKLLQLCCSGLHSHTSHQWVRMQPAGWPWAPTGKLHLVVTLHVSTCGRCRWGTINSLQVGMALVEQNTSLTGLGQIIRYSTLLLCSLS